MAKFIEADVIQKIATEAEWLTQTRIPYKGQIMIVSDSSGKVTNIKVGDGVNPFSDLNYMFDSIQQNAQYVPITSNALPTPLDDVAWGMVTGGTYTFGGVDVFTVPAGHWGIANYISGAWSLVDMGELPQVEGVNVLNPNGEGVPKEIAVADYVSPIFNSVDVIESKNKFNPRNILPDLWFSTSINEIISNASTTWKGWFVEDFQLGQTYTLSGMLEGAFGSSVYLDENDEFITSTSWTAPTPTTRLFTVPNNPDIKKIWFNVPKDGSRDNFVQLEVGNVATEYEPYGKTISIPADVVDFTGSEIEQDISQNSQDITLLNEGFSDIADLTGATLQEKYIPFSTNGYINTSGDFVSAENWRTTDFIPVTEGQNALYYGFATGGVVPVTGYDINKLNPVIILPPSIENVETPFIIPSGVSYIRPSFKGQDGDVQSIKLEEPSYQIKEEAIKADVPVFMPKTLWGQVGEEFRMYPAGITAMMSDDHHLDFNWSLPMGCRDFVTITPENTSDKVISASVRNGLGVEVFAGTTTLKVAKETPTNPASMRYVLCLGDSLTQAGIWVSEFSRHLTGVGLNIGDAVNDVSPRNFTNVSFIGTRTSPNTSVPREGNGGWAYKNWLNDQSFGGNNNSFWNPSTEQFDLNYWISQNSYTGVDSTGSNLTIYTMCLWNSVYLETIESAISNMDAVFQIIHSQRPNTKIKVMGLNTPPAKFLKPERGSQTPYTVMEDIIRYNKALEEYAEDNSDFVEFICISPQFHPEGCYPSSDRAIHLRASDILEDYPTDHVHPNNRGYAQIADAAYANFIYNYCN